ncbi:transaldolase [Cellulophaga baltica]|uniref:transaldolase n=1 Tax=Cellulophaga TaxID=104264 RepID=UPI001C075B12|nr:MULTISPECIES: transaldolase [Cellulophaga]MBU2996069.1 transaldolase [Cellulophaga baltica]MDO6767464.1 transaldolase [Cellulophaga sp. 1_MG-2023]
MCLIGCNSSDNKTTIFAGEIVNPTSETVILYKDDIVVDSAQLDMHNRFSITLNNIDEGLYNFRHAPQYQYIYLSKGDSLMVRLNTMSFDESLVFSGHGEEINNFLIEVFLNNEEEEPLIESYYKLDPLAFSQKIDSLRKRKTNLLSELKVDVEISEKATAFANASINYSSYINKEKYPFVHNKRKKEGTITEIPEEFYTFRKGLDFDNKELTYFTPYYDYMKRHFDNLAYNDCATACVNEGDRYIKDHLHFNLHKLKLIDSLVNGKKLRDNLFRNVAMSYFLKVHDNNDNNKVFLESFHELSSNNKHIAEIHDLYEGVIKMQPSHTIPEIDVIDSLGNKVSLKDISNTKKDIVFYFWTGKNSRHFKNIHRRVAKLKMLKPNTTFIGISLSTLEYDWKKILKASDISLENQYQADDIKLLRNTLIIDGLNKAIVVNDGLIVDAYKNIYRIN